MARQGMTRQLGWMCIGLHMAMHSVADSGDCRRLCVSMPHAMPLHRTVSHAHLQLTYASRSTSYQ